MQAQQLPSQTPPQAAAILPAVDAERERLEALDRFDVLDTPSEEAFDRITRLARKLFGVPVAIVSFVDAHRQWYKSCVGLTDSETPRGGTFCKHVIDGGEAMVISDTTKDARFRSHPAVLPDPGVRFYAGVPLKTSDGHSIGSLCLVDFQPREFFDEQLDLLKDLASMVMAELELRVCATDDSLTGALSRRSFKKEATRGIALALRHHSPSSIVAIDLDHFKSINDTFGHSGGDLVLARSVQSMFEHLRDTDLLGRIGGEEFAVLLPSTGLQGAVEVAEKLRASIEAMVIDFGSKQIRVTASFGVASLDAATQDVDTLLAHADQSLYEAKRGGRNRCAVWRDPAKQEASQPRRRVLKAGQIRFNGNTGSIDCTVRSLSAEGAGIDVSSSLGIPKIFDLAIKSDDFQKPCRIESAGERHIEVAFC